MIESCFDEREAGERQSLHTGIGKVHNIEERLEPLLSEEHFEVREPSLLVRASGHLLLWTMAAVVCYAATL